MRTMLLWFSATGNTARAAGIIADKLAAAGDEVRQLRLGVDDVPAESAAPDRVIVLFPTLSFAPPASLCRLLACLPRVAGTPAVVAAVDGGGCYCAPLVAARLLRRRGYDVGLSASVSYPENWTQAGMSLDPEKVPDAVAAGDASAAALAGRILANERGRHPAGGPVLAVVSRVVGWLFLLMGRRFLGKTFHADARCNSCRLCEQYCPAAAIRMGRSKNAKPRWNWNCDVCNRCINICPQQAINLSTARLVLMIASFGGGVWAAFALLWPLFGQLGAPWTTWFAVPAWLGLVVLGHVAGGLASDLLTGILSRVPGLGRLFDASPFRKAARYTAPGFRLAGVGKRRRAG